MNYNNFTEKEMSLIIESFNGYLPQPNPDRDDIFENIIVCLCCNTSLTEDEIVQIHNKIKQLDQQGFWELVKIAMVFWMDVKDVLRMAIK